MSFDPDENLMAHAFGLPVDPRHSLPPEGEPLTIAELDAVCAVVAVTASTPVRPSDSCLAAIRGRLNLPVRRTWRTNLPWAGWGMAAALAALLGGQSAGWFRGDGGNGASGGLVVDGRAGGGTGGSMAAEGQSSLPAAVPAPADVPEPAETIDDGSPQIPAPRSPIAAVTVPADDPEADGTSGSPPAEESSAGLLDELEALRERLAQAEQFSVARSEPVPGVSWPVVIAMRPPGSRDSGDLPPLVSRITEVLTDAGGAGANRPPATLDSPGPATTSGQPSAFQIYDPARDTGTLTYRNLPTPPDGMVYTLWVTPAGSGTPTFVGSLPRGLASTDAVDFALGAAGTVPERISLWLSPEMPDLGTAIDQGTPLTPVAPSNDSILILQGP